MKKSLFSLLASVCLYSSFAEGTPTIILMRHGRDPSFVDGALNSGKTDHTRQTLTEYEVDKLEGLSRFFKLLCKKKPVIFSSTAPYAWASARILSDHTGFSEFINHPQLSPNEGNFEENISQFLKDLEKKVNADENKDRIILIVTHGSHANALAFRLKGIQATFMPGEHLVIKDSPLFPPRPPKSFEEWIADNLKE